ncbi:hypothetical protein C8Q78DRAFT_1033004 [Trametes maxima]|nr:hypothetical protein C8Q78DRAFT_1033004 [Trametes maxima]
MKTAPQSSQPGQKNKARHQPYNASRPDKSLQGPHASSGYTAPSSTEPSAQPSLPGPSVTKAPKNPKQKQRVRGEKSRRLKAIQDALDDIPNVSYPSSSPPTPAEKYPRTARETIRDFILEIVHKHYSYYTPRSDFEIVSLGTQQYKGKPEDISAYMDKELARAITRYGSLEAVNRWAKDYLDVKAEVTGAKPRPGDYGVFVLPLPDSDYSIRIFPGSLAASEYCLDFVRTATGEPVNSPFKFQLISGPNPSAPMGIGSAMQLRPLEHAFGISQKEIAPGEEKFLLRDGQTCLLRRPGHKDVQFVIPIRRRPEPPKPTNTHFIELPKYI